jgi:sulfite reductase (NADPH) flavoprotein alpha-component
VLDVLERFPSARPAAAAVVRALDELQPRLYSISSSPTAHAGEVHLTVGVVHDEQRGRKRRGVASNHLGRVNGHALPLRIYLQPSHGFALPEDDAKPVVMVGPGTGIAPFRAFLHERKARGAKGRSWLFFGNPYGQRDFLYREELEELRREGALTRLDTAFSRDQAEKVYVQHRILEAGPDLWSWLNEGAHVYVCGDAKRMASDVDKALREIAARHGGMDEAGAKAWLKQLADVGRYQRDVY